MAQDIAGDYDFCAGTLQSIDGLSILGGSKIDGPFDGVLTSAAGNSPIDGGYDGATGAVGFTAKSIGEELLVNATFTASAVTIRDDKLLYGTWEGDRILYLFDPPRIVSWTHDSGTWVARYVGPVAQPRPHSSGAGVP